MAYPTEGVWGLGCDPFNPSAVHRLLDIKQRSEDQGLVLIAGGIDVLLPLIRPPVTTAMLEAFNQWPAAITFVFPASDEVPKWVRGKHDGIALRISAHPLACRLCQQWGRPLVSTSANLSGQPAALDEATVRRVFGDKIDTLVPGSVLTPGKPSEIRTLDGKILRS